MHTNWLSMPTEKTTKPIIVGKGLMLLDVVTPLRLNTLNLDYMEGKEGGYDLSVALCSLFS